MSINPDDADVKASRFSPAQDRARDVRRTCGDVEHRDRLARLPVDAEAIQMPERRPRVTQQAIDPADVAEALAKLLPIDARRVHPFIFALPMLECAEHDDQL